MVLITPSLPAAILHKYNFKYKSTWGRLIIITPPFAAAILMEYSSKLKLCKKDNTKTIFPKIIQIVLLKYFKSLFLKLLQILLKTVFYPSI